jgi:hypothetical protein
MMRIFAATEIPVENSAELVVWALPDCRPSIDAVKVGCKRK